MPVNLPPIKSHDLLPVSGVRLGTTAANIRKPNRKDLLIIELAAQANIAGVFTQNRFCAAPVTLSKSHMSMSRGVRALLVNTGCANAGTGEQGITQARVTCSELAKLLGCETEQVLPFSTGVIMEPLPVKPIVSGLPACVADLATDNWYDAAHAIMTTDTIPKAVSKQIKIGDVLVTITGIAKGAGMIHPNMATMLAFIATDARIAQPALQDILSNAAQRSFNCITIDGDTSTNDAFMLIATNQANMPQIKSSGGDDFERLSGAVNEVATLLAQAIVRDGEGATKFITVQVESGKNEEECRSIAFAIAHSPLVKTAFFASDPNLGRILAAIGYAGADLDIEKLQLYLDDVLVVEHGGRAAGYRESDGQRIMRQAEITIRVVLNRGVAVATVWTCDFSYDYVKINAEYRS